ncbi:MAG: translation initiation factor IF-2 [Candidatus Diapherotrites archaeon]|nr:translation initiation factor IF-2 [Candidatus Diapherotrites archaeon]
MIRKPIITVLGHVDSGKTTLLDFVRGTAIADREAGRITQHIGATEVPISVVRELAGELITKYGFKIEFSGLLFIDTPGHEAFTNLRKRGGSIADLAVLVIDLTQGFKPQTLEAIEILKSFKVPFLVAANKVDKVPGWVAHYGTFTNSLKVQSEEARDDLDKRVYEIVGKLYELGFQSDRFDRVTDFTKQIPIIPISAKRGDGVPELLMFLAGLSQRFLEKKLAIHEDDPGVGTVLEVKEERGLGKTIDVIVYDGVLSVGDEIVVGGKNGVIKTKIRALLEPKPLNEIRDPKEKFNNVKQVHAAAGVKVAAPNLDEALAGSPMLVVSTGFVEKRVADELKNLTIESGDVEGPIVRTDALGSLEALVLLLNKKEIHPRKADVGDVTRKDVLEAASVAEKNPLKGVIFAFNTKILPEAAEEAQKRSVTIFKGNVIYRLLEEFEVFEQNFRDAEKKVRFASLVFPGHFRLLPNHVFRNSKPLIVGVRVLGGRIKTDVSVISSAGKRLGHVLAVQQNGKSAQEAKKGEEIALSIEDGVFGRNVFDEEEIWVMLSPNQLAELSRMQNELSLDDQEALVETRKMMERFKQVDQE